MDTTNTTDARDLSTETICAILSDRVELIADLELDASCRELADSSDVLYAALLWRGMTPADIEAAVPGIAALA